MRYTNSQLLAIARERATKANLPQPRTKADIENLTGFALLGSMPDPQDIGKSYSVSVTYPWSNS